MGDGNVEDLIGPFESAVYLCTYYTCIYTAVIYLCFIPVNIIIIFVLIHHANHRQCKPERK